MEKILTVCIPTYNMEKYLDKCLTSLIIEDKELMKQLEVLVVIDGAKDRSSVIAHSYQDRYPETFHVIDKENGNYGSCINRGLKEATGKYFRILDADDSFNVAELQKFLLKIKSLETLPDLICTNYSTYDEDDCLIDSVKQSYYEYNKIIDFEDVDFWVSSQQQVVAMHAFTYKTALLLSNNYKQQTGISYTDTEFVFIPLQHVSTNLFLDIVLYRYLIGRVGQTVSQAPTRNRTEQYYKVAKRLLDIYEKNYNSYSDSLKHNLNCSLKNVVRSYFFYTLCFLPKETESEEKLKDIANTLKKHNESLWMYILGQKQKGVPFVKIWASTGIYVSDNVLFKFLYKIKQKVRRWS